ncbi:HDOD domain-containing protein [candidate division KSB1 bacterium]
MNKEQQNERIKRIAQNVLSLPALPTIIAKMIELIDDPKTSASQLAKLISTDQVLTTKILKMANSAYYGFPRRIATINLAIVILGFDMLKDVGLGVSIIDRFKNKSSDESFDMSRFWEHSIACGVIGKMLARKMRYRLSGEVFVAGVIHDIGKLILNQYFTKEFDGIMERVKTKGESFKQAELEELGIGHALIGSWLAEKWNLPEQLVEAIRHHHTPNQAVINPELTAMVHFSDFLCKWLRIGYSGDDIPPKINEAALQHLNLHYKENIVDFDYYAELVNSELEKAETFINLIQGKAVADREFAD